MNEITKEELREIKEDILKDHAVPEIIYKKLIYDGRQYSLRIPVKFVEEAEINIKQDEFRIELKLPKPYSEEKPEINIKLVRENEKEETRI